MDFRSRKNNLASRIKAAIIEIDMNIALDRVEMKVADSDYRVNMRVGLPSTMKAAMKAKATKILYQNHIHECEEAKKQLYSEIDYALRGFPEQWRKVWMMYYLTSASVEDIGEATDYAPQTIRAVLKEMKREMNNEQQEPTESQKEADRDPKVSGDSQVEDNPDPDNP